MKPKIILYELNEVPKRLINYYVKNYPNSAFARIISEGMIVETFTYDNGELHPWSTWPTVHRGVDNRIHNIRYLNQDLEYSSKYKPIWEILVENNISVGVFGSLQSFPPKENYNYKFYLPDTFSPSPDAYPSNLSLFQKFNLALAGENKAISRGISKKQIKEFLLLTIKGIINKLSALKAIIHIIKEQFNPQYKSRRSTIQNVISFKIFLNQLEKNKPEFATYFTNHVAGMMHRYWKYLFPNDFSLSKNKIDKFHSKSILKAMQIADNDLKDLMKFSKRNGYNLLVVSSMGQKAIDRGEYIPELVLRDFESLMIGLELNPNNYQLMPAMQPDYCIEARDKSSMDKFREVISKLKDLDGLNIFIERYKPVGLTLNLSLIKSRAVAKNNNCKFNEKKLSISKFGLELIKRDIGTGYHTPEGILIWFGEDQKKYKSLEKTKIDTCSICPTILDLYGIEKLNYMKNPLLSDS